jgi:hypothetical protein
MALHLPLQQPGRKAASQSADKLDLEQDRVSFYQTDP